MHLHTCEDEHGSLSVVDLRLKCRSRFDHRTYAAATTLHKIIARLLSAPSCSLQRARWGSLDLPHARLHSLLTQAVSYYSLVAVH